MMRDGVSEQMVMAKTIEWREKNDEALDCTVT